MLALSPGGRVRIYLCLEPADMRKGFNGLSALVAEQIEAEPTDGSWYVFRNRRGDRLKILAWDKDGYALWYKMLEAGTFRFPSRDDHDASGTAHGQRCVTPAELTMLLDGIELSRVRRRKRYRLPKSANPAPPTSV